MRYDWPSALAEQDMLDIIDLMNSVALRERTLGFDQPLSRDQGLALMRSYDAELRQGTLQLLAVRDDDSRIVAMVTLARAPLPARRHIVDMRRCVIAPQFRGQFLLEGWERVLRKAREIGCDVLTLEVREDGPVDLWRRIGFRDYGFLPDYARRNGDPVAGYYMYANCAEVLEHFERTGSWFFEGSTVAPASA